MSRFRGLILIPFLLILVTGCARRDKFTVLSKKPVDLPLENAEFKGRFEGEHTCWGNWIIFWGGNTIPSLEKATERALKAGDGNLLVNADVYEKITYYPWILTKWTFRVSGDVYQVNPPAGGSGGEN